MNITYRHFKVERDFFFLPVDGTGFFLLFFFIHLCSPETNGALTSPTSPTRVFFRFSVFLFRALSLTREQVRERSRVRERPGASLDLCRVTAFVCILRKKEKKINTSSRTRPFFFCCPFSLSDFFWFQMIT